MYSSTRPVRPTMAQLKAKAEEIFSVLDEPDVDLWKLRELALTEGGLVNDAIRKQAWPKLVGLHGTFEEEEFKHPRRIRPLPDSVSSSCANNHSDEYDPPICNGDDASDISSDLSPRKNVKIAGCVDAAQIDRDVARCTWHLLTGSQRSRRRQVDKKQRKRVSSILHRKQRRLANLIKLTLLRSYDDTFSDEEDRLRYYQGYHDVASIFLATLGGAGNAAPKGKQNLLTSTATTSDSETLESVAVSLGLDLPCRVLGQVSHSHFRDAMKSSFMQLQAVLRLVLFPLISAFDPEVHAYLQCCDMEPFFAISWVITWFSHDVRDTELVKRLFDAFIVSHPLFSLYLSVAMVLHPVNRMQVLTTECDFACIHQTLVSLPRNSCMEGWKYNWGDGLFVSDDDDVTVSTDFDGSHVSDDFVVVDGNDDTFSETDSFPSVGPISPPARVPFQELIDRAISYMRRIPPRKLLALAKRYYAEETVRPLLKELPSINLFQNPPVWALISKAKADWVLKQRERERLGLPSRTRKDRRKRILNDNGEEPMHDNDHQHGETDDDIKKYLKEKSRNVAVIASGFGPGDDTRCRNRRRVMISIAVAVLAVSIAVFLRYRSKMLPPPSPSDVSARTSDAGVVNGTGKNDQCGFSKEPTPTTSVTSKVETREPTTTTETLRPKEFAQFKADGSPVVLMRGEHGKNEKIQGPRKSEWNKKSSLLVIPKAAMRGLVIHLDKPRNDIMLLNHESEPFLDDPSDHALVTVTRVESLFSLQSWTSLQKSSLLLAQAIHRAMESKMTELIRTTKAALVVLDQYELPHDAHHRWLRLPEKSREIVHTVCKIAKRFVTHVKIAIAKHEGDLL